MNNIEEFLEELHDNFKPIYDKELNIMGYFIYKEKLEKIEKTIKDISKK